MASPRPEPTPLLATVELLRLAKEGDVRAQEQLFTRYLPRLRRWAAGRLPMYARSLVDTADLVQETLVRVFKGMDRIEVRGPGGFQASLFRRTDDGARHLANGDRVSPGDRLSLEVHTTVPAWIYVLNDDERGERYLLFPQPLFDARNPVDPSAAVMLPGTIGGRENAWTVTSAGGREHFIIVASPEPVAELEAELGSLPAPRPDRPVQYARVGDTVVERLRGVGGVAPAPAGEAKAPAAPAFDRFRTLEGRERGVRGVWVRQITLENPAR